jgi:hypothetical protein
VVAACIIESLHPYADSTNLAWFLNNPDSGALSTRVHFSRLEVEEDYDFVYLKDYTGQVYQSISGTYSSGLWSDPIPGSLVEVQLASDSSATAWGFCVDMIETVQTYLLHLPLVIKQPTPTHTPTPTATPCACYGVCSCHGHCSCNPHCICDTIHYWHPN